MPYADKTKRQQYAKKHYQQNKLDYLERAKAHTAKNRAELRAHIDSVLAHSCCVDCGESDPVVLEFDHLKPLAKLFCIGEAATLNRSLKSLKAEIAKCEVRCANCHRRKTIRERNLVGSSVRV